MWRSKFVHQRAFYCFIPAWESHQLAPHTNYTHFTCWACATTRQAHVGSVVLSPAVPNALAMPANSCTEANVAAIAAPPGGIEVTGRSSAVEWVIDSVNCDRIRIFRHTIDPVVTSFEFVAIWDIARVLQLFCSPHGLGRTENIRA